MRMSRLKFAPFAPAAAHLAATIWLAIVVGLTFAAGAAAQENNASTKHGVSAGPGGPAFTCGVCDDGYTPLNGAGWQICWRTAPGQGLVLQHVCFQQQTVLFEASQPFVIVPYKRFAARFKDGLGSTCGGVPYVQTTPTSATVGPDDENPGYPASSGFPAGPAYDKVELAATYDTFNYRYRQRWIFRGTGDIDAMFGFGGFLIPSGFNIPHIHSPYWRLDFDLDDYTQNFVEEFTHPSTADPDTRVVLDTDGPRFGTPSQFQKWTVRSNTPNAQGQLHGWDIEPVLGTLTELTTADFWAMTVSTDPDMPERGAEVGHTDCSDYELANVYSKGNSINGADVVVWVAASSNHEPRHDGEEGGGQPTNRKQMPGHEWVGIHLSPRNAFDTTPVP
jgi:hypothetical protein